MSLVEDKRRRFVSIREMSEILGIGKTSAYELISSGEIPAKRFGKRAVRVPIEELERFIERSDWTPV